MSPQGAPGRWWGPRGIPGSSCRCRCSCHRDSTPGLPPSPWPRVEVRVGVRVGVGGGSPRSSTPTVPEVPSNI